MEKHSTIVHLTTCMSALLINNNKQTTVNAALRLQMTHQLRNNLRGRPKQVGVHYQNHQPLLILLLKHPLQLQVPVGMRIQFLSLQTLFQALRKMLLRRNSNTGHKSVPDLAATTDFKTGTISASLRSTPPASANSWDRSSPISLPSSKSTSLLILLSVIQKPEPYSIITPLWTIIWCWTSHSWSPIKMI